MHSSKLYVGEIVEVNDLMKINILSSLTVLIYTYREIADHSLHPVNELAICNPQPVMNHRQQLVFEFFFLLCIDFIYYNCVIKKISYRP